MVRQIAINGYDNNFSYFVSDALREDIAIVDPGNVPLLLAYIEQDSLIPKMILLTHSHHDHVDGVAELIMRYALPVYMHENAKGRVNISDDIGVFLRDNDEIKIGDLKISMIHTPGHIDDAVCYYIDEGEASDGVPKLITGDTLFVEACGRADLEYSNVEDLYKSLQRIKALPDNTEIYPGHDYGSKPVSTLAWEKKHNQYIMCKSLIDFIKLRL